MSISVENFLDNSFKDILDSGRELFLYRNNRGDKEVLNSIGKKMKRLREEAERLNFKKTEEISNLLESVFYYAGIGKISVDDKFSDICLSARNICCDLLNSIRISGVEKSQHHKKLIGDMMKYLEFHIIDESFASEYEAFDGTVEQFVDDIAPLTTDGRDSETMSVLIVESAKSIFFINQKNVASLEQVNDESFEYMRDMEFYQKEKAVLPVVRLNAFFNLEEDGCHNGMVIVVEEGDKQFCIVADTIRGHCEITLNELDMGFPEQEIYMGTAMIDEGMLGFVLDLEKLFEEACQGKKIKFPHRVNIASVPSESKERMLVFNPGNEKSYGVPVNFIERIEKFSRSNVEWSGEQAIVRYGKRVLPIVNFGLPGENNDEEIFCMVVDVEGIKKGFVVKNILDVAEFDDGMDKKSGVMGMTYLGEKPVTVINPALFWSGS